MRFFGHERLRDHVRISIGTPEDSERLLAALAEARVEVEGAGGGRSGVNVPVKLRVDREADALYLRLDDSVIVESEEVSPGVVLDYNEANEVVGVEMLRLSERSSGVNLSVLQFETT